MERNFGIELEFTGLSMRQSLTALHNAGLSAQIESYNHNDHADGTWKIVTDASVHGGHEVVSPILHGEEGIEEACRAASALEAAGAKIDKTCGFHVHFDAAPLTVDEMRTIFIRYAKFEKTIDTFMPGTRRGDRNSFCKSIGCFLDNASFLMARSRHALANSQAVRYFKVNLQAYLRHHTIEFRQHSGTVDKGKIENWVRFLAAFMDESIRVAHQEANGIHLQPAQKKLIDLISGESGMSAGALQERLQILPHTLRGNISYLRKKGIQISTFKVWGETVYKAMRTDNTVTVSDQIWNGIDESVHSFYLGRIAQLEARGRAA